jgi:3-hydroxyacyl-[acyl-carrier-protein] dehydratase
MPGKHPLYFVADHPVFAGHFPGQPIVPGVMLLDAAIHAIETGTGAPRPSTCRVSSVKFLSPVAPEEDITLNWNEASKAGQFRFDIEAAGRPVATGVVEWDSPA